ncbi:hypothetical protein TNIN_93711 [Trichonephila inaurata madagascariensis]|uniref:Uncharacterized protein n=1 Tax=Trichonephila inaurata madagascariensis TaxID=2747483 RepID=A0A8X6Y0B4_9ARAC|nr:hypothetical protein TNIN_93711 [Trichonephila inaurata madagascariensis]
MQRLSVNAQAILSASTNSLSQLAHIADKVCQITESSQPIVYSASHSDNSNTEVFSIVSSLAQKIEALTTQFDRLSRKRNGQNVTNSRKRSRSRTFNNDNRNLAYCRYHNQFVEKARKCIAPCAFNSKN